MEDCFGSARIDLVLDSEPVAASIGAAGKTIEHGFFAGRIQFEYHPVATGSAGVGGAVEVAGGVLGQRGGRVGSVCPADKVVEDALVTGRIHFIDEPKPYNPPFCVVP